MLVKTVVMVAEEAAGEERVEASKAGVAAVAGRGNSLALEQGL